MRKVKEKDDFLCSICRQPIEIESNGWKMGHNAEPVNSGRCCAQCNDGVVLPLRLARMIRRDIELLGLGVKRSPGEV